MSQSDDAISEIVGFVMIFAIIGSITLVAMLAFGQQRQDVDQRIVELRAASVAERVAVVVADVGRAVDATSGELTRFEREVDLPPSLEGSGYTVRLLQVSGDWRIQVSSSATTRVPQANVLPSGASP